MTSPAFAAISVVAATPELADITKQVGGDKVSVYSIAKPNQDYHMIEPRPSDVSKIARADLVVRIGLDLDMWLDALSNAAGNPKVRKGGRAMWMLRRGSPGWKSPGNRSRALPATSTSTAIHITSTIPTNGKIIAHNVLEGLIRVSPGNKSTFQANYEKFATR